MFHVKLVLVFVALVLLAFSSCGGFCVFGASEGEAVAAVAVAGERIVLCYDAVAEADDVGANVTALLARLGEAGELFSRAELSYGRGDFDSAVDFADQSESKLDGFVAEADALAGKAVQEYYWDLVVTFGGSVVGVVVVVCSGFVVWHFFKKRRGGGAGA